ncbi:MAG: cytochrome c551/c552 [Cyclobacteriaceae bacterium]
MKNSLLYYITLFIFILSCSSKTENKKGLAKYQKRELNALQVILKNDCLQCHSLEDRVVGPPYLDISRRYKEQPQIKNTLANKIREGGGGLWYGGMMSGHPLLKKSNVNKIVTWILSLDDKHNKFDNQLSRNQLEQLLMKGTINENGKQAILAEAFALENPITNFSSIVKSKPDYSALIKQISLSKDETFSLVKAPYVLKFSGDLEILKKGKYFFRLQKSGSGQVFLDNKSIISNTENDHEIALDMEIGKHPFIVYYSGIGQNDQFSFSWIKPGDEYYSLISFD